MTFPQVHSNTKKVCDRWQITFIMLNGFHPLSNPPPPPPYTHTHTLSLTDNIKLNWLNTIQIWMKNALLFYTASQVFQALLWKTIRHGVRFNDLWFLFHDSSLSFYEPYFSRIHIYFMNLIERIERYGLKPANK